MLGFVFGQLLHLILELILGIILGFVLGLVLEYGCYLLGWPGGLSGLAGLGCPAWAAQPGWSAGWGGVVMG